MKVAAILHDLPIKLCKEKYAGDASQTRQGQEASALVKSFLRQANYPSGAYKEILDLVLMHHCYEDIDSPLLQLLIEADLIVNLMEEYSVELWQLAQRTIKTQLGKSLLYSMKPKVK